MGLFTNVLGTIIKEVAERNFKNDKVKTADSKVFDALKYKLEEADNNTAVNSSSSRSRSDMYKDYYEKVKEAQKENEVNPNVETADGSVYEDMLEQLEVLKRKVESQSGNQAPDIDFNTSQVGGLGARATTNSGGSIQFRMSPDMGSPKSSVYIPDGSQVNIIEFSENKIILDGKESRFVFVEHNGHRGWVLENYLR